MSAPIEIASAIQSASIKRHPSPAHDLNPSTAASTKRPVSPTTSISTNADSIPESAVKPVPRRANLPPLPDLRFEQSYLASLKGTESWWGVAWITGRDQVLFTDSESISDKAGSMANGTLVGNSGTASTGPGYALDLATLWLAALEPRGATPRC